MANQLDFSECLDRWPPVIAREKVGEYTGGLVNPKTLANLDSLGQGPRRVRVGRKIGYPSKDFLTWLAGRARELA